MQPEHVPTGKGLLASSYNNRADALVIVVVAQGFIKLREQWRA